MTTTQSPPHHRALFAAGVLFGLIAEQVVLFAVPLIIFQNTKSLIGLGVAFALEWLPSLIAYPFAGLMADRDGGARLFRRVALVRTAILGTVGTLCVVMPSWTTAALMTGGACLSLCIAPVRMSVEKVVPQLAGEHRIAAVQSLVQNMELLAMALGPALAALAALYLGKVWLLFVAAAVFAGSAACWLPLPRGAVQAVTDRSVRAVTAELLVGWRILAHNRPVLLLGVLNFAINLALAALLASNAALVTGVFRAGDSAYGLLNTAVGVMGLINLLFVPMLLKRFGISALGAIGFTLLCAALLLTGFAPAFPMYAVGFVAVLVGDALYNVFNRTQRLKVLPREHLGKVMGPFYLLNLLSFPIAGVLVASVGATLGPQHLITGLAILLCLFGAVFLPLTMVSFHRAIAARVSTSVGVVS
ncbi:MFS transporter [Nocardia panacis]|uniref:MFS transporter n=1 Tax=Nocardia panacis TaxID=2340916 RepID=A0A3A4KB85_9NOCA|nr:MFS transporter [Nocardia panacis]RJO70700.1 MFS transporter [Nocardia panacis]